MVWKLFNNSNIESKMWCFFQDFYNSPQVYENICSSFWCSKSQKESHCHNHIASDGFVCGNNKVRLLCHHVKNWNNSKLHKLFRVKLVKSGHFGIFGHPLISRTRWDSSRLFLVVTDSCESLLQLQPRSIQRTQTPPRLWLWMEVKKMSCL